MFNRFKLGRTLDEAYTYGCDLLFQELALAVCAQEGIDLRFNHLDTTSFALSGEYVPDSDEHAITITHGYSKDHRPDLKQAVLELMVSQDGGVPFVSKSWDGNTSDIADFPGTGPGVDERLQERAQPAVSGRRRQTLPRGQCPQPPNHRLYHTYSQHPRLGLAGDHASPQVGHLAPS